MHKHYSSIARNVLTSVLTPGRLCSSVDLFVTFCGMKVRRMSARPHFHFRCDFGAEQIRRWKLYLRMSFVLQSSFPLVFNSLTLPCKMETEYSPPINLLFYFNPVSRTIIFYIFVSFVYVLYATWFKRDASLNAIPGPWLASVTRLWVVFKQRANQRQVVDMDLHDKYGPVVRISPTEVMFSSPSTFRVIFGMSKTRSGTKDLTTDSMTRCRKGISKGGLVQWSMNLLSFPGSLLFAKEIIQMSDCGWRGPDVFNLLIEQDLEKYRIQRRLIGPALTADAIKPLERNIGDILVKDIAVMHARAGEEVDVDFFFNSLASGRVPLNCNKVPNTLLTSLCY